jgi:hypothetical protein
MTPSFRCRLLAGLLAAAGLTPAHALDVSWSGFATLGWTRSNSDYTYQRFINRDGSFKRDSLVAGQLDLSLSPQWSATVQAKAGTCEADDHGVCVRTAWAFVAWRPDNDWLVRLGKARLPLYLYSESLDIGVSNDMVRLPHEMYSIAPTNDFTGAFVTRNFSWGDRELTLEGFGGRAKATARLWLRDGIPPVLPAGPLFKTVDVKLGGLVMTVRDSTFTGRLALMSTSTSSHDGRPLPVRYPRVDIGPGMGYWKVDASMPGPAIETTPRLRNLAVTAGVDWQFAPGWRVAGEYVSMQQRDSELGSDSKAGYVALFRRIGDFTPYVSLARQRSSDVVLGWRERLTTPGLPAYIPGAAQINATQRVAGESGYAFDQRSQAVGVSYALSPTSKLKGEWMRTRVGRASGHFDAPAGQPDAQGLSVNTLSVVFTVAF